MKDHFSFSFKLLHSAFLLTLAPLYVSAQERTPEELPEITVTADPLSTGLLDYGKPVSVLDEIEIGRRSGTTLGDAVGLEPGVHSSSFGQGASRPVIRGFAGERVRVLKNGITTGDVSDISDDHVVAADPLQADQIEVLRGPETLLYGSSAIGGVVNVTEESIAELPLGKPFEGEILTQFGNSADNERTFAAKLRAESGPFNWYLSSFSRESDDYEIPGFAESSALMAIEEQEAGHEGDGHDERIKGKVPNTATDSWGTTGGASYVSDYGFFGISFSGFSSDYGIPGHVHHDEEEAGDEEEHSESVRIEADQKRIDLRGRADGVNEAIDSVKFRFGFTDYEHDEIEGGQVATHFVRDTMEGRLELLHAPIGGVQGAVGLQFLYDDLAAIGDEAFITPTETWAPALFLFEKLPLSERLDLHLGGRVESVTHDPELLNPKNFVPFSLSFGPVLDLGGEGEYTLGLTSSYSERAPSSIELFADGPHLARQIFEVGDSGLDKESAWGVDLVIRKNRGFFQGALTPFYQQFSNYLNLASTGEERESLPLFQYEEIDAYFWGFEWESSLHFGEFIDSGPHELVLEHQLDYVKGRNEDQKDHLPRISPLRNVIRARYNHAERLEALIEGVIVNEQDDTAAFEIPTDSYTLLNAELGLELPSWQGAALKLFVRGTNLTDEEARVHTSFLKDLAPLKGRSFLFGLRADF
ncbi:MAG: TonB-dependent receptor [Deltaproteobacteria bacterium]|nr:TonB-dependent receptor [Deltaproteobacteria bacterium]